MRLGPRVAAFGLSLAAAGLGARGVVRAADALSLDDCVRLAAAAPSPVAVAERQSQIADARVQFARAGLLPRLSLQGGYARNGALPGSGEAPFVSLNGANQYTALLVLGEELDLSGRLRAARARARFDQEASAAGARISRRDLRRAVAAAYHRLLLARRLATVASDILVEGQRFATRADLLFRKGEAARADVVKATAEVALQQQAARAAALEATLANQELASFWTDQVSAPLAVVDEMDAPAAPAAERPRERPELALLEAQRRGLEADARAARAARYPQGSVVAEYGLDGNRVAASQLGYAVILGVTVPLLDWGSASSAARQFSLQAEQVAVEQAMSRRAYAREYASAQARVEDLYAQIAIAREQVRLADENLKLSRVRYEGGEASALEVVSAQAQLAQARGGQFQTIAAYLQARVDLQIAEGR